MNNYSIKTLKIVKPSLKQGNVASLLSLPFSARIHLPPPFTVKAEHLPSGKCYKEPQSTVGAWIISIKSNFWSQFYTLIRTCSSHDHNNTIVKSPSAQRKKHWAPWRRCHVEVRLLKFLPYTTGQTSWILVLALLPVHSNCFSFQAQRLN